MHQFSDKMDDFEFLGPNLPKNGFWDRNFKNRRLDSKSTPPCVPIFNQNGQLLIFRPKFGNCRITCNILVQILLRVLQRGRWRLNELGGGGWSWVEVGAWFSNSCSLLPKGVIIFRKMVYDGVRSMILLSIYWFLMAVL